MDRGPRWQGLGILVVWAVYVDDEASRIYD